MILKPFEKGLPKLKKEIIMNKLFSIDDISIILSKKPNWSVDEIIKELQLDTTRTKAIRWWNNLSTEIKESVCFAYLPCRSPHTLTGREIEYIYTQSK